MNFPIANCNRSVHEYLSVAMMLSIFTGRRKVVPNPKRKIKELGLQSIKDTLTTSCCEEVCLSKFYMAEVENLKSFYWEMDSCHQRQFIRDTLRKGKGEDGHHFFVNGRRICEVAWKTLYGVKDTRYE